MSQGDASQTHGPYASGPPPSTTQDPSSNARLNASAATFIPSFTSQAQQTDVTAGASTGHGTTTSQAGARTHPRPHPYQYQYQYQNDAFGPLIYIPNGIPANGFHTMNLHDFTRVELTNSLRDALRRICLGEETVEDERRMSGWLAQGWPLWHCWVGDTPFYHDGKNIPEPKLVRRLFRKQWQPYDRFLEVYTAVGHWVIDHRDIFVHEYLGRYPIFVAPFDASGRVRLDGKIGGQCGVQYVHAGSFAAEPEDSTADHQRTEHLFFPGWPPPAPRLSTQSEDASQYVERPTRQPQHRQSNNHREPAIPWNSNNKPVVAPETVRTEQRPKPAQAGQQRNASEVDESSEQDATMHVHKRAEHGNVDVDAHNVRRMDVERTNTGSDTSASLSSDQLDHTIRMRFAAAGDRVHATRDTGMTIEEVMEFYAPEHVPEFSGSSESPPASSFSTHNEMSSSAEHLQQTTDWSGPTTDLPAKVTGSRTDHTSTTTSRETGSVAFSPSENASEERSISGSEHDQPSLQAEGEEIDLEEKQKQLDEEEHLDEDGQLDEERKPDESAQFHEAVQLDADQQLDEDEPNDEEARLDEEQPDEKIPHDEHAQLLKGAQEKQVEGEEPLNRDESPGRESLNNATDGLTGKDSVSDAVKPPQANIQSQNSHATLPVPNPTQPHSHSVPGPEHAGRVQNRKKRTGKEAAKHNTTAPPSEENVWEGGDSGQADGEGEARPISHGGGGVLVETLQQGVVQALSPWSALLTYAARTLMVMFHWIVRSLGFAGNSDIQDDIQNAVVKVPKNEKGKKGKGKKKTR